MTMLSKPLVRERAFYGGLPYGTCHNLPPATRPETQTQPLKHEETHHTLFKDGPPGPSMVPPRSGLRREQAIYAILPANHDHPPNVPPPHKRGGSRQQSRRDDTVKQGEKKRVRFGTFKVQEKRRTSGRHRDRKVITVRSILKPPHTPMKEARRSLQPGASSRTVPVQYAGLAPGVIGRPRQTSSWMLADRWIEQSTIRGCSLTCKGCRTRIKMSFEQTSLVRLQRWKRHKAGCERIREWAMQEQKAMSLRS